MINNYNSSEKVTPVWFTELKEKYPTLWYYEKKNSKSNGKAKNSLIDKMSGKQQYNSING
jgi:hypothetical protein